MRRVTILVSGLYAAMLPALACAALEAMDESALAEVAGQGIEYTYTERQDGNNTSDAGNWNGAGNDKGNNSLYWQSYRADIQATIKAQVTIDSLKLGGYQRASDNGTGWDVDATHAQLGGVYCTGVAYYQGSGGNYGQCASAQRTFEPVVATNPFFEVQFAPECELFNQTCTAANSNSVFAGMRLGFQNVSGHVALDFGGVTGFLNADIPNDIQCSGSACWVLEPLLASFSADGLQVYGYRQATITSIVLDGGLIGAIASGLLPPLGQFLNNLYLQEAKGLWISLARNEFQWAGQGVNTGVGADFRDRDYQGWNMHLAGGTVGHGGGTLSVPIFGGQAVKL